MLASDSVWELVCGLPSGKREARLIVALKAFIDDSGSDPQSSVFVLAGYISDAKNWALFSDKWQAALDRSPKIEYFKMNEAMGMRGQFAPRRGWDRSLRDARVNELSAIIRDHTKAQLCASLRHTDFEETLQQLPVFGRGPRTLGNDHPYLFLWYKLISEFWLQGGGLDIREPVDFIFDEQLGFAEEVVAYWARLKSIMLSEGPNGFTLRVGNSPIFMDDKDALPLQAADLYAWSARREIDAGDAHNKIPEETLENLAAIPSFSLKIPRDYLVRQAYEQLSMIMGRAKSNPGIDLQLHDKENAKRNRKKR